MRLPCLVIQALQIRFKLKFFEKWEGWTILWRTARILSEITLVLLLLLTINPDFKQKGWRFIHLDFHTSISERTAQSNRTLSEGNSTAFWAFHIVGMLRAKGDSLKTWKLALTETFYSFGIGFLKAFPKDRYMNSAEQCLDRVSATRKRLNNKTMANLFSSALWEYRPRNLVG